MVQAIYSGDREVSSFLILYFLFTWFGGKGFFEVVFVCVFWFWFVFLLLWGFFVYFFPSTSHPIQCISLSFGVCKFGSEPPLFHSIFYYCHWLWWLWVLKRWSTAAHNLLDKTLSASWGDNRCFCYSSLQEPILTKERAKKWKQDLQQE